MPAASILIKPASANCNMDCKYCFYKCLSSHREEYSKGFMTEETLEDTCPGGDCVVRMAQLAFSFQGGEPTSAGPHCFKRQWKTSRKYNNKKLQIENTIQQPSMKLDSSVHGNAEEEKKKRLQSEAGAVRIWDNPFRNPAGNPN